MKTLDEANQKYEASIRARSYIAKAVGQSLHGPGDWQRHVSAVAGSTFIPELTKAATPMATTTNANYAGPFVDPRFSGAILELVRPRTVIDRLDGTLKVPAGALVARQTLTAVPEFTWVGEFRPVPVVKFSYDSFGLPFTHIDGTVVISRENALRSDTQSITERGLISGLARGCDRALLDPTLSAIAGERPASLTYGVSPVSSSGNTAEAVEADLAEAFAELSGGVPEKPFAIMSQYVALQLLRLRSTGGEKAFPGLSILGGDVWGAPVIISQAADNYLVLIDASGVAVSDMGVEVSSTQEAALLMDDDPAPGSSTNLVSLFQANAVAVKASRWISWTKRSDAVSVVDLGFGSPE